jgi:xanthine dehydrogenase FAD-binding subunit
MERFNYARAQSVSHALALLAEPGVRSRVLAGGTDLLVIARSDPQLCDRVVDISRLAELRGISLEDGQVTIGACTTFAEVVESDLIQRTAPLLAEACRQVGAVQIRNTGTLGGNVTNAAACADSLPALVCLDATAHVATSGGACDCPVADLVLAPNRTRLPPGGLLVSLSYAVPHPAGHGAFLKLGRRNALAISRLTVAALGRLGAAGRIVETRLVAGAATPQIRRLAQVEAMLLGQAPTEVLFQAAGEKAGAEMIRLAGRRWSSEYKEPVLAVMVERAMYQIFAGEAAL